MLALAFVSLGMLWRTIPGARRDLSALAFLEAAALIGYVVASVGDIAGIQAVAAALSGILVGPALAIRLGRALTGIAAANPSASTP